MLDYLERLAEYLHGFRWWFLLVCVGVIAGLAFLDFRGHEVGPQSVLSFMWLFGIAFFVRFFQRTKRVEEMKRMKGIGPRFMHNFLMSDAFWHLAAWFFVVWFGFLTFATVAELRS
jgi:hypothetical protein